ncbi:neural-cadherin-like [Spea bombifrons]|uniref:neural-cadherin-like n=1 Tax=Spea bombifrons TaxID=233779 RepID=UPI00234BA5D8|nr:neural-cadherin-like [Spea bombifrons]
MVLWQRFSAEGLDFVLWGLFSRYRTFVSEEAAPNTLVATLHAFDPDGDHVSYSILEGNREGNVIIDSEKGIIRLGSNLLPKHHGAEYVLYVTATDDNASGDPHSLTSTTTVVVTVDDVNQNKPVFHQCAQYRHHAVVLENQPPGTFVLQVEAKDADVGVNGQVKYGSFITRALFLHSASIRTQVFNMLFAGLVYTLLPFYPRVNRDSAYVRVFISDVNDNQPAFTRTWDPLLPLSVPLIQTKVSKGIIRMNAKICYQITAGNNGGALDVDPETGAVFIFQPLNYEEVPVYELTVLASDGKWEDYATVMINVLNKNDEAPVFSQNEYQGHIMEELSHLPVLVLQTKMTENKEP